MHNSDWLRQLLTSAPFTPQALVSHSIIPAPGRKGLRRMYRILLLPIAYCLLLIA